MLLCRSRGGGMHSTSPIQQGKNIIPNRARARGHLFFGDDQVFEWYDWKAYILCFQISHLLSISVGGQGHEVRLKVKYKQKNLISIILL